jgi:hypothetical protein
MGSHNAALTIALTTLFVATPCAARAADGDDCEGWFCTSDESTSETASAAPAGESQKDAAIGQMGTITLPGGVEIPGRILELLPGDHVTLLLADGTTRAIAWPEVVQISISARIVIGGAPEPAHPGPTPIPAPAKPEPPATTTEAEDVAVPVKVVDEPRPILVREHEDTFEPGFTIGAYLSLIAPGDSLTNVIGAGGALELDGGFRFAKHWRLHGVFELSQYAPANATSNADSATGVYVGGGLELNLAPDGPIGWLFDIGMGVRSLDVPIAGPNGPGVQSYSGFEPLRLAIGLAFPLGKEARLDIRVHTDVGTFAPTTSSSYSSDACNQGTNTTYSCPSSTPAAPTTYSFTGIAIGTHFSL